MIPEFDGDGNLPSGIHQTTFQEFTNRFGNTPQRIKLIGGLLRALFILKRVGCRTVYVDGSFVSSKSVPNDFDACWDTEGVDAEKLYEIDPVFFVFDRGRASQKAKFSGELFPASWPEVSGKTWLEFFQTNKENGRPKGIIAIDLETMWADWGY